MSAPILSVRNLSVHFGAFAAVDDLSFDLYPGQKLALVGESGSGKSVTALSIMQLLTLGSNQARIEGELIFTRGDGSQIDLCQTSDARMRGIRGNDMAMIFQEPLTSLNPVHSVGAQLIEAIRLHQRLDRRAARAKALAMLQRVRIPRPQKVINDFPHQLSGGMRQRVMIAMALSCDPRILIADEPTTALDVTIQAQILALMDELQQETGAAVLLITHDMGVVAEFADQMVVMRHSRLIEQGSVQDVFAAPQAPYTRALLASVPRLGSMRGQDQPALFDLVEDALA